MRFLQILPPFLVSALLGCGSARESASITNDMSQIGLAAPAAKSVINYAVTDGTSGTAPQAPGMAGMMGAMVRGETQGAGDKQPGQAAPPAGASAISRKIIYDAQVDLVVEDVNPIAKKLTSLVQDARGYVADENTIGSPGSQRSMRWKIRVPVDQFESFVQNVVTLGELERTTRTSQDVTEQYYDIEARIKNKKAEEKTLTKILEERTGKLEDVLKVEVELSRVRGEIEQFEGRIRVLENLSSLATLTLNVRERQKFEPPAPVAADFPTQVARTWDSSVHGLVNLGKSVVLWAVDWAVWVPLLIVGGIVAWLILRWLIRVFVRNLPRLIALARTPITPPPATPGNQP